VLDTVGTLEQYRQLDAHVLMIYGSLIDPLFVDYAAAPRGTFAFDRYAAAGAEPRLTTRPTASWKPSRRAAAVLRGSDNLTAGPASSTLP
jgi:hypothetical protein